MCEWTYSRIRTPCLLCRKGELPLIHGYNAHRSALIHLRWLTCVARLMLMKQTVIFIDDCILTIHGNHSNRFQHEYIFPCFHNVNTMLLVDRNAVN